MKKLNLSIYTLCGALLLSGCGMSNTGKGSLIGAGAGTGVGALVGGLVGKGKGAGIGAAVGAGAGALIGRRMDKAKAAAEAVENAQVETVTDNNGLQAVKVTFDSGILFATGDATLSNSAKASLSKFATNVLNQNTDMDVSIKGYTDNQGWKNSTAAESQKKNLDLSQVRAQSVQSYLLSCGVQASQITSVEGLGEANPVASNDTKEGQQQNRRVEVYLYASQEMIKAAEAGTLQ
mgnify:CR=1 FL=1